MPFLIGGLFVLWMMCVQPGLHWLNARDWQEAEAVILESKLDESRDSDGSTYEVVVTFRYHFSNRSYESSRYSFSTVKKNIAVESMREAVSSLPKGQVTACWVNPARPEEAVLDRSMPTSALFGLCFSVPFITIGLVGLGLLFHRPLLRRIRQSRLAFIRELCREGSLPPETLERLENPALRSGAPMVWIASDQRLPSAVGFLLLNLLWNGLVSVFILGAIDEWRFGSEPWFLTLFLVPFVAVGAGLFWAFVQAWRQLAAPVWVIALQPIPGAKGGEIHLWCAWKKAIRLPSLPRCTGRILALAAPWDAESSAPSREVRLTRRHKHRKKKTERELHVADFGPLLTGAMITVHLPPIPACPAPKSKLRLNPHWCRWWALEVIYPDGSLERVNLTQPEEDRATQS